MGVLFLLPRRAGQTGPAYWQKEIKKKKAADSQINSFDMI